MKLIFLVFICCCYCIRVKVKKFDCELDKIKFEYDKVNVTYEHFMSTFKEALTKLSKNEIEFIYNIIDDDKKGSFDISKWNDFCAQYLNDFINKDEMKNCFVEQKNLAGFVFEKRINESLVFLKSEENFMDNKDDVFKSLQYIFNYVEKENSINKRDVDVIIKTFKYIFIDQKIENFMEICRILLIFFNFKKSITEGLLTQNEIEKSFQQNIFRLSFLDNLLLKDFFNSDIKSYKYINFQDYSMLEIYAKIFKTISPYANRISENNLIAFIESNTKYNINLRNNKEEKIIENEINSIFTKLLIENNQKDKTINSLISISKSDYYLNGIGFAEFVSLMKSINLFDKLVSPNSLTKKENDYLINMDKKPNFSSIDLHPPLSLQEKEDLNSIYSYSKCKNLSIIQLFQILNYKRHWEYYIRYHSRGSISYEDFLVIFKHLKLNTDHVNQIIHSNLIITLSEAKSESTFESEFLYTFNTTCTS